MAKWPKVKLADCVNLLAGFPFKSQQFTEKPDDVPLVKGENVSQGCILWDISKRWPASDWERMEKFHLLIAQLGIYIHEGRGQLVKSMSELIGMF